MKLYRGFNDNNYGERDITHFYVGHSTDFYVYHSSL